MNLQPSKLLLDLDPRTLAENVFDTVYDPLLIIDGNLKIIRASDSFYKHFRVTAEETIGLQIYNLGNGQWDRLLAIPCG